MLMRMHAHTNGCLCTCMLMHIDAYAHACSYKWVLMHMHDYAHRCLCACMLIQMGAYAHGCLCTWMSRSRSRSRNIYVYTYEMDAYTYGCLCTWMCIYMKWMLIHMDAYAYVDTNLTRWQVILLFRVTVHTLNKLVCKHSGTKLIVYHAYRIRMNVPSDGKKRTCMQDCDKFPRGRLFPAFDLLLLKGCC
jgi:hypothetical protein